MAEYIVQKPADLLKLTAKARIQVERIRDLDITPKFDGCCAVLTYDVLGRYSGAFSATGELAPSMDRIGQWIATHWTSPRLRGIALIGEAWMPATDFPTISGTFRRKAVQEAMRFVPFDAVTWTPGDEHPLLDDPRPYRVRIEALRQGYDPAYVLPLIHQIGTTAEAHNAAIGFKALGGFDGAIARDPTAPYTVGRCKFEVVKFKPVLTLDLLVVGWNIEPGVKTGRPVLTLEVEYQGVRSWVGSGVPHDMQSDPRGQIVEVECMGVTADGKLREPRFKGVRYDKVETD
jgi:ATP-dependent DNA ligase